MNFITISTVDAFLPPFESLLFPLEAEQMNMASDKNIRCHHCAGPLSKEMVYFPLHNFITLLFIQFQFQIPFSPFDFILLFNFSQETSKWNIAPLIRDSFSMVIFSTPRFLFLVKILTFWFFFMFNCCGLDLILSSTVEFV